MTNSWILQGDTTITNLKVSLTKSNLSIYANGKNLVLGTDGNKESLKIGDEENKFYPNIFGGSSDTNVESTNVTVYSGTYDNIYGGSNQKNILNNTNLNIKYAVVNGNVYGGSIGGKIDGSTNVNIENAIVKSSIYGGANGAAISGNTNLNIKYAEVNEYVYGGSNGSTITGTSTTIIENGKYGIKTRDASVIALSGGSYAGTVGGVNITINDATVINGCITGAGNSNSVTGKVNLTIEKLKLAGNGAGNNSIYGYGYNGGTGTTKGIDITIKEITGKPAYITGYCYSNLGQSENSTISMNLSNINSATTEIYGGSYNGSQTKGAASKIITNNVKVKLLSAGGLQANSIKSYNITINDSVFDNDIYAGIGTNSTANVVNHNNVLNLNNYTGKILLRNRSAIITATDSNVTTADNFYTSDITLKNSNMEIGKSIYSVTESFKNIFVDETSVLSINNINNAKKQIVINGKLSGNGKLLVYDTNTITVKEQIDIDDNDNIEIDIIESSAKNHYVDIISQNEDKEEKNELVSAKELINEQEVDKYKIDFISSISYWRFYKEDENAIKGQANCVYLDSINGNDNNLGTIKEPVKTIQRASEIIKNDSSKDRAVITADLNLNLETKKEIDKSDIYTLITSSDGNINFQKNVKLNNIDGINNIYQNLMFENLSFISDTQEQNIYLNNNKLIIGNNVTTNVNVNSKIYINIYGGSNNSDLEELNSNIQIRSGIWYTIYGGNNEGNVTNKAITNVTISGGTIYNIYGGSNKGNLNNEVSTNVTMTGGTVNNIYGGSAEGKLINDAKTNVTISGGTINITLCGGNNNGTINGTTNLNVTKGTIKSIICGGSYNGDITGSTKVNISGGNFSNYIYAGNYNGTITGTTNLNFTNGTVNKTTYGGSYNGAIIGTTNVIVNGGNASTTTMYGGSREGKITGNTNFELKDGIIKSLCGGSYLGDIEGFSSIKITGGEILSVICTGSKEGEIRQVTTNQEDIQDKATNLEITGGVISGTIYGGGYNGNIIGNICLKMSDITFNKKTSLYRGSKAGALTGEIISDISNIYFATTDSIFCSGSSTGQINGDLSLQLNEGTFKNNICNAIVYGGSESGNITGNLEVKMYKITFNSQVYGGSGSGLINGNTTFSADGVTCNSNLYGIGKLGLNTNITEINSNVVEIKNSTVKENLFAVDSIGTNIQSQPSILIDNVSLKNVYAFKTYSAIDKEINITISNSSSGNGEIKLQSVENKPDTDLSNSLVINLINNKSIINIQKGIKLKHFKIENSEVIAEEAINANDLTLISNGSLDLKKKSIIKNNFSGAVDDNYGRIYVYDGLDINGATGTTILEIGTITETKSKLKENSPENSFINENGIKIENQETELNKIRKWTFGNLNGLNIVYLDGANGNDGNSGADENNALATLKQAYYYCIDGGVIVVCGPTSLDEQWPKNSSKEVTITSKYNDIDYIKKNSAVLTLNSSESAINLQKGTTIEHIKICVSKSLSIYANGNKLVLGDSIEVVDSKGNKTNAYLNIYGGAANTSVNNTELTIKSGSYNNVYGGRI